MRHLFDSRHSGTCQEKTTHTRGERRMNWEELRKKIRWAIEFDGRSHSDLAKASNFSINSIANILNPDRIISVQHLMSLCDALGLDLGFTLTQKEKR
jgi:transcriptional regulator with XRE-family HTH domain